MATIEIRVPVLAESIAEANLLSWHKKVGDRVERGDNLIDIETDKVTLEVPAPMSGIVKQIVKQNGEDVGSDELIAVIDTEINTAIDTPQTTVAQSSSDDDFPEQQTLLGDDDAQAVTKISPAVRRLFAEHGLQAEDITVRQHANRITKQDVLAHLATLGKIAETSPPTDKEDDSPFFQFVGDDVAGGDSAVLGKDNPPLEAQVTDEGEQTVSLSGSTKRQEDRVPMTRLRKRAAERLLLAQQDSALLTTFNEVNMQAVIELRQRYKQTFEETHGVKLGFMSFFTKAAVEALKQFPVVNAAVDGDDVVYKGYFDIGIAVGSSRGLVVPILRDADLLSFAETESKIAAFGRDAEGGKLAIDDLVGGTFTITNGGVFGSLLSTPIVNPPQSAILGMHAINQRPISENGEVVIRPMMYLALSYDHRIIDGREAVQFLVFIKSRIEDPARLLLQI